MSDELFEDVDRRPPSAPEAGPVRYETANRTQVELRPIDLEAVLPPGHAARLVWRFVEGLDLSAFYVAIKAREGGPGRTPIDPKILIALWLYATIDGVGSARAVDRLCDAHDAYRWICGGVSVNYHTLSDFRVGHAVALDDLLTQSIAALLHGGIVTLARVAQDGTRVRASAGTGSFRREATLQRCLQDARQQVERTQRQDEGSTAREAAAQARAATERLARVEAALAHLPAIAAAKAHAKRPTTPRASTTDADARIMKMCDRGFRPAYNVHFATDDRRGVVDPTAPIRGDSEAVAAWRQYMATDDGKQIYKERAAVAEWVNADARHHRTLTQINVRGLPKVHTWALWVALAHKALRTMGIVPHLMT